MLVRSACFQRFGENSQARASQAYIGNGSRANRRLDDIIALKFSYDENVPTLKDAERGLSVLWCGQKEHGGSGGCTAGERSRSRSHSGDLPAGRTALSPSIGPTATSIHYGGIQKDGCYVCGSAGGVLLGELSILLIGMPWQFGRNLIARRRSKWTSMSSQPRSRSIHGQSCVMAGNSSCN